MKREGTKPMTTTKAAISIDDRLANMEAMLSLLVDRETTREWYNTAEFARIVGKAEFTCREWCRLHRVHAEKRSTGRGAYPAWVISHQELIRYQHEGLLPTSSPSVQKAT